MRRNREKKKAQDLKPSRNSVVIYHVIFGSMELSSPYLWKKGEASKPLLDEMKITHQGRTETVEKALTDFGIEESFAQAAKRFQEHYKFRIPTSTVNRVTKSCALDARAYLEKKLQGDNPGSSDDPMLVELDGCEIRTGILGPRERSEDGQQGKRSKVLAWREVRVGLARPLESEDKLYVAQVEKYPEIVSQLFSAATLAGMGNETLVVAVADGAQGLREEVENQFHNLQFILDKPHLRKHLFETAEQLGYGKEEQYSWVHSLLDSISRGNVLDVLKDLRARQEVQPNNRLRQFINYLDRFKDAVNYDHFKELGYPIGSGEVESAHRSIPQKRLKVAGACWHPDSLNPLLALRVLRANGWWDDYWSHRIGMDIAA